jgi:hypothetical protein
MDKVRKPSNSVISLLSGEYPTTELSTELQRHSFSASLAELNSQLSGLPQMPPLQLFAETEYKTPFPTVSLLLHAYSLSRERVYHQLPTNRLHNTVAYLPISWSLHSNSCTHYNIFIKYFMFTHSMSDINYI